MSAFGDLTITQAAYSARQLLERATPYCILQQTGQMKPLPGNNTKTISMRRYKFAVNTNKFSALGVPMTASGFELTEGVTPAQLDIAVENFDLTLKQYGLVTGVTDVVDDAHIDPVLQEIYGGLGEVSGPIVEMMQWEAIRTGSTNVKLAGGVGAENLIVAALSLGELRAAVRNLRGNHARFITKVVKSDVKWGSQAIEPAFIAVFHSDLEGTIRKQFGDAFTPVARYGSGATVLQGEFGKAENVRDIVRAVPLTHLLLETDAPFLTPLPYRGVENSPKYLPFIAEKIAEVKGVPVHDVLQSCHHNSMRVFFA